MDISANGLQLTIMVHCSWLFALEVLRILSCSSSPKCIINLEKGLTYTECLTVAALPKPM